jgi:FkbM family methyltransferase
MLRALGQHKQAIGIEDTINRLNKVMANRPFALLIEDGQTWLVFPGDVQLQYLEKYNSVTSILLRSGDFEKSELDIICANLHEGLVFFDVGANVGLYTIWVAKKFQHIQIHAFEPVPETCEELRINLRRNNIDQRKVTVNPVAVGSVNNLVQITTEYHSSNYVTTEQSREQKVTVSCVTLDAYVRANHITRVDLIKIDVEGKEFQVLNGARDTLRRFQPILQVELIERPSVFADRVVDKWTDTVGLLHNMGYSYYVIDDQHRPVHMHDHKPKHMQGSYHNYFFYHDRIRLPP